MDPAVIKESCIRKKKKKKKARLSVNVWTQVLWHCCLSHQDPIPYSEALSFEQPPQASINGRFK